MADLSEVFDVANIAFSSSVSIESGENKSEIILSSKKNGFVRFNLETMKVVQSWPKIRNQSSNTTGVFHVGKKTYFAVMKDSNLYSWTSADSCLSSASVLQMNQSSVIQKLHPIVHKDINDLVLVDSKGKAHLLSKMNQSTLDSSASATVQEGSGKRYIWSTVITCESQSQVTQIMTLVEDSLKYKLNIITLKEENQKLMFEGSKECILTPPMKGSHIVSCVMQGNRLIVLYSHNTMCAFDLDFFQKDFTDQKDGLMHSKVILKLSDEYKVAGKGISKGKLGKVDADHVFVVSKYVKEEKSSGIISVFNTKFGTEQASITFPLSAHSENPQKEQEILAAQFHAGHVVVALSKSVVASSCKIRSSSLAASIGKLKRPRSEITKDGKGIYIESPFIVTSKLKKSTNETTWTEKILNRNKEEQKALERLSDQKKTPSIEKFTRELDAYLKKLGIQVEEKEHESNAESTNEPKKKKRKGDHHGKERNRIVPDSFVQAVLSRCLSNDEFWSSKIIVKVLKTSCVSQSLCADLMEKILEKNSLEIMDKCFEFVKEISEVDIVRCLRHLLSQSPDSVKLDETCFKIVLNILNYPFNDYAMQESLRQLNKQETKILLQILFQLLIRQSPGAEVELSHEKVIDWLSMTINAQFTSLILANDLTKMIKRLQKTVANQMKLCEKLETIEPFLLYFKKTYKLPKVERISCYSVETIKM